MRVLFFATGMGLGGAESQICELARRMSELGHSVHIAWMAGELGVTIPKQVRGHPMRVNRSPFGLFKAIWCLRRLVRKINPDIIHAHMVHANLVARLTRLVAGIWVPLICTAHSSNEGGKLRMFAYRVTDGLADLTTNVSEPAVDVFLKKGASVPGRLIAVPNGVDVDRFCPDATSRLTMRQSLGLSNKVIILSVGRLEYPKNPDSLIKAYAQIAPNHQRTHLLIVGYGSLEEKLKAMVNELGLAKRVSFLGARQDIAELFNAADIVAVSSRFEGFGLVLAEAMACAKFIVTTDCGGIAAAVSEFGLVVPVEDDRALASGLERAVQMPEDSKMLLGEQARGYVTAHYAVDVTVQKWLRIYGEAISQRRRRHSSDDKS